MSSVFNRNLIIIETANGNGVNTLVDVPAKTIIFEFKGDFFTRDTLKHDQSYTLQIGKNKFLGPSGGFDDYINHSCNPNCGLVIVGSRAFLLSLYVIKADTEITFDYSTSSNDTLEQWQMNCKCGQFCCRKIISGYQYLNKTIKEKYQKLDVVPSYIIKEHG